MILQASFLPDWLIFWQTENYEFSATQKCFIILFIILFSFALDWVCKRILAPLAKKIALRTESKWDDYLLNDDVLSKVCHLVPPRCGIRDDVLRLFTRTGFAGHGL